MNAWGRSFLAVAALGALAACSSPPSAGSAVPASDPGAIKQDIVFAAFDVAKADAAPDLAAPGDLAAAEDAAPLADVAAAEDVAAEDLAAADLAEAADAAADAAPEDAGEDAAADAAVEPDAGGSDAVLPTDQAFAHLCDPCAADADCSTVEGNGNLCVADGTGGSFCGVACDPGNAGSCPNGYECSDIADAKTGAIKHQCTTTASACSCSPAATLAGLETACSHKTAWGTCVGVRSCKGGSLSACTAAWPAQESCNGEDDDCNGKVDDFTGSVECKVKNPFGICKGAVTGCDGAVAVCSAKVPAAEICNQIDDNCDGQIDEGFCGDGDACTQDVCSLSGPCSYVPFADGACDDKNACTADSCDSVQGCLHAAVAGVCDDDGNGCTLDECQNGKCAHSVVPAATACDDGNPCTSKDICVQGACTGSALDCSKLENDCNTATCTAGQCVALPKASGTCNDGDACTVGDSCSGGFCKGKLMDCGGLSDACNSGVCQAGVCTKQPVAGGTACDDGSPCTSQDHCSGGACSGTPFPDAYEPNANQPGTLIANKSDCDGNSLLTAAISPQGDVDWYQYDAQDETFCTFKPKTTLTSLAADYDLCMFFLCSNGETGSSTVNCNAGLKTAGGPKGSWGCCSTSLGLGVDSVTINPECTLLSSGNDSGTVWLRVQGKSPDTMCGGYLLNWAASD